MKRILICGDSFAADWTVKYSDISGWPNLLADTFNVTNIAQAGVGEYKILQQVKSENLLEFTHIIISHTSPYRVHCPKHPIHYNDILHHNADLIYNDVSHYSTDPNAKLAVEYFEKFFDLTYYSDVANLICDEILNILGNYPHLNQFHIENYTKCGYTNIAQSFNINSLFVKHRGLANHLSDYGNQIMFTCVNNWISNNV